MSASSNQTVSTDWVVLVGIRSVCGSKDKIHFLVPWGSIFTDQLTPLSVDRGIHCTRMDGEAVKGQDAVDGVFFCSVSVAQSILMTC